VRLFTPFQQWHESPADWQQRCSRRLWCLAAALLPGSTLLHHPGRTLLHHLGNMLLHHLGNMLLHHPGRTLLHHFGNMLLHHLGCRSSVLWGATIVVGLLTVLVVLVLMTLQTVAALWTFLVMVPRLTGVRMNFHVCLSAHVALQHLKGGRNMLIKAVLGT